MAAFLETYSQDGSGLLRFEARAMGTENVLLLAGADEQLLREAAQAAFEKLERLESELSKFLPESDVGLLNRLGAFQPVRLGRHTLRLLELSREAWELTGGAFDPTVGPLLEAWGLVDMEGRVPTDREIEDVLAVRGMDHVIVDRERGTATFDRPGVAVDFGAIGKGYAVDAIAALLVERGVTAGVVISGRSSVLAWGAPPGLTPESWEFEVVHPDDESETVADLVAEPGSVSSSGASVRRFLRGGKEYGHIIDPRTGRPARRLRGVTIWTESALLGDVLSTAVFVLGRDALGSGGPAVRLLEAWKRPGTEARASILVLEEDSGVWGGLHVETFHVGRPGFRLRSSP